MHVSAAQQLTSLFKSQNGGVSGETKARVNARPKTTKARIRAQLVVRVSSVGLEPRRFGSKSIKRDCFVFSGLLAAGKMVAVQINQNVPTDSDKAGKTGTRCLIWSS